ncbi:Serine/threonine-protein kinase/endoribonuclease ire-1, partial [Lamellibrachia satsuma]
MPVRHDTDFSYIALELCDYSLETWLKQKEVKDLTEEDWRMKSVHLIGDLLHGLEHIHAKKMLHRDLKPQNLFVVQLTGGSQCLKIADFGLTRSLENGASTVHTAVDGTRHWLPKEVIVQMNESTASESTESESTTIESSDSGSSDNESTDSGSTDSEPTDRGQKIKYKQSGDMQ